MSNPAIPCVRIMEESGPRRSRPPAADPAGPVAVRRIAITPLHTEPDLHARPELRAMLAVSTIVAAGGALPDVLDRIAAEAVGFVAGSERATIFLMRAYRSACASPAASASPASSCV